MVITLLSCFYFLRISAIFSFVGAVLISLFYECNAYMMHHCHCNTEPTIIRRVLRENQQNNCYCNLDDKSENIN